MLLSLSSVFIPLPPRYDAYIVRVNVIKSLLPFCCVCFRRKSKARPRDFKQAPYPDAAAQIMLAGIGTLVALSSEEEVRKHESDNGLMPFDEAFEARCV